MNRVPFERRLMQVASSCSPPSSDDIRNLLQEALYRIPLIPWSLVVDTWRWHIFEGRVKYEDWNAHWWHLRESLQGVKSPVPRWVRADCSHFKPQNTSFPTLWSKISFITVLIVFYVVNCAHYPSLCLGANINSTPWPNFTCRTIRPISREHDESLGDHLRAAMFFTPTGTS